MKGQPIFGRASAAFVAQRERATLRAAHRPTPDSMCVAYGPEHMDHASFRKEVHSLLEHARIEQLSIVQMHALITVDRKVQAELMEVAETGFDREGLARVFAHRERLWDYMRPRLIVRVAA